MILEGFSPIYTSMSVNFCTKERLRYTVPSISHTSDVYKRQVLNDVGTEELAHLEMVSTIVHQLTRDLSMEEIEKSGLGPYYLSLIHI